MSGNDYQNGHDNDYQNAQFKPDEWWLTQQATAMQNMYVPKKIECSEEEKEENWRAGLSRWQRLLVRLFGVEE